MNTSRETHVCPAWSLADAAESLRNAGRTSAPVLIELGEASITQLQIEEAIGAGADPREATVAEYMGWEAPGTAPAGA